MTFASKYELLEPVTSGSVETFVARSLATDERVLVHIFECPVQRPDQPTVQWVLESFYAIAPQPAELVLGTGKYGATTYAYLVTKLPESAVLHAWIRSYQARQETSAVASIPGPAAPQQSSDKGLEKSVHGISMTIPVVPKPEQQPAAGASPTLSDSEDSSATGSSLVQEQDKTVLFARGSSEIDFGPAKVEQAQPGEFTRQFFSGSANPRHDPAQSSSSLSTADSVDDVQSMPATGGVASPKPKENAPGRAGCGNAPSGFPQEMPTSAENPRESTARQDLFGSQQTSQSKSSLDNASANGESGKTGEFTRFFQGPFHGERAANVPSISSVRAQPKSEAGEFTKVFGASGNAPNSAPPSAPHFTGETSAGLSREDVARALGSAEGPEPYASPAQQTEILEANRSKSTDFPYPSPRAAVPPELSIAPAQPTEARFSAGGSWHEADTAFMFRPKKEAATSAFAAPGGESAPARTNLPTGPSEFTKIISGGLRNLESEEEEPAAAGPQNFLEKLDPPAVPPGLPSFRAASPPGHFPQAGLLPQTPMPTKAGAPAALSQIPELGAAAPKVAATPWTLILILNGLFLIAVLLVLYFALKH